MKHLRICSPKYWGPEGLAFRVCRVDQWFRSGLVKVLYVPSKEHDFRLCRRSLQYNTFSGGLRSTTVSLS
jgi:hypothetical protein